MNILITGATGFIGSYVAMEFWKLGHSITILARNKNKVSAFNSMERCEVLEISMTDYALIKEAVKNKDVVVHVALNYNDNSAFEMLMNDSAASIFLATEAEKAGVKQFIYTSSTAANDSAYAAEVLPPANEFGYHITMQTKQAPQTYYGATKAATENFLLAISYQTNMKVAVIRPGYTFGNPVIEGAFCQPDTRFKQIAEAAKYNKDIEIVKHDGTQFIWAGDLAKIYSSVFTHNISRKSYFGLGTHFTSWQEIAEEAVKQCNSKSKIIIKDLGWRSTPLLFDVTDIEKDFNLKFSAHPHLKHHIEWLLKIS